MESRNLTKKLISELPVPTAGKRAEYYDSQVKGLMVRVTDNGARSFYVRRKKDGVSQRIKIGPFPEISLEEARQKALELCSALLKGENPLVERKAKKAEPTFGELLDTYLEEYANAHCVASKEIAAVFRRYYSDWKHRKMDSISNADCQRKINEVGKVNGPTAANHALTYARAAINWCIANKYASGENPFSATTKFKTQARERFLRPEELEKFFAALKQLSNEHGIRDYIYLSLLTGARQANVLAMRWDQLDLKLGIWTIPRTKSGESQTLPLTQSALAILFDRDKQNKRLQKIGEGSEWVFPGNGASGHLVEPKKGWYALLEAAELNDLRMHDLRRTLGSYMAIGNQSLHVIGKVLGHKSASATQIYSKLTHDPLRQAMEKAEADMLRAAGIVSIQLPE